MADDGRTEHLGACGTRDVVAVIDVEPDGPEDRGMREYLRLVARRLGVDLESCCYELTPHAIAYLALDGHLPLYPEHRLALEWDEYTGWRAGIEIGRGDEVIPLAWFGPPVLPEPASLELFVARLLVGGNPGRASSPVGVRHDARHLAILLAGYTPGTHGGNTVADEAC